MKNHDMQLYVTNDLVAHANVQSAKHQKSIHCMNTRYPTIVIEVMEFPGKEKMDLKNSHFIQNSD